MKYQLCKSNFTKSLVENFQQQTKVNLINHPRLNNLKKQLLYKLLFFFLQKIDFQKLNQNIKQIILRNFLQMLLYLICYFIDLFVRSTLQRLFSDLIEQILQISFDQLRLRIRVLFTKNFSCFPIHQQLSFNLIFIFQLQYRKLPVNWLSLKHLLILFQSLFDFIQTFLTKRLQYQILN